MHRTRDHLCLVADLFDLQAVASAAAAAADGLSPAACAAFRDLYRQASDALRRTLDRLPVAILNLELEGAVPRDGGADELHIPATEANGGHCRSYATREGPRRRPSAASSHGVADLLRIELCGLFHVTDDNWGSPARRGSRPCSIGRWGTTRPSGADRPAEPLHCVHRLP